MPVKCQKCKENGAIWAMQYIGEDRPSFYRLGSHIRGFSVVKVCDDCKEKIKEENRISLSGGKNGWEQKLWTESS